MGGGGGERSLDFFFPVNRNGKKASEKSVNSKSKFCSTSASRSYIKEKENRCFPFGKEPEKVNKDRSISDTR